MKFLFFCGVNRDGPYTAKVLILVFFTICLLFLGTVSKQLYKYNALKDSYMVLRFSGKVVSGADFTHDGMVSNPGRYTDCFTGNHFTGRIGPTTSRRRTRPSLPSP